MVSNITSELGNSSAVVETIAGMELQGTICEEECEFAKILGEELELYNLALQVSSELLTHLLRVIALDHRRIDT